MAPESQIEMGFSLAKFHQEALSISTSLALLNYFVGEQKKTVFCHRTQLDDVSETLTTKY